MPGRSNSRWPRQGSMMETEVLIDSHGYHQPRSHVSRRTWFLTVVFAVVMMAVLGAVIYVVAIRDGEDNDNHHVDGDGPFVFKKASVAADTQMCSSVGKSILAKGGNAVDASIAAMLCTGLGSPQSMGIGGGFFMTLYQRKDKTVTVLDARETAPEKATQDMFVKDKANASKGGLSIAVPGEIRGYWMAHNLYGKLRWKELFEPTIKMADEGFPVPVGLTLAMEDSETLLTTDPVFRSVFVNPSTGRLFKTGETMKRTRLAKTLRVIADEGADAFYNGSLTDTILEELGKAGSIVNRQDLKDYTVLKKEPVHITLDNGQRVYSPRAPSGGPILSLILNLMDGYQLKPSSIHKEEDKILTYHRLIEAFKFAYAKRTNMGDEDFVDVAELTKNLTSREFANALRQRITDDRTHNTSYYDPAFYNPDPSGTSHLSVIDQDGNAVAVTTTINARFGSDIMGDKTGIIYNDEMDDFSTPNITNVWGLRPSPANFIKPGKRPLSSMCPALIISPEGDVLGSFGAAGGSMITTAVAWVISHATWLGDDIRQAISRPRLHHQLLPPWVQYEQSTEDVILLDGLKAKGHEEQPFKIGSSISQGIVACPDQGQGRWCAYSDPRKGGVPDGF